MKKVLSLSLAIVLFITTICSVNYLSFASDYYDENVIDSNVERIENYIYKNGYRNGYGEYAIQEADYSGSLDHVYIIKNDNTYNCLHFIYYVIDPITDSIFLSVDMLYNQYKAELNVWTTDDDYSTISAHTYMDGLYHHQKNKSSIYIDYNQSSLNKYDALDLLDTAMSSAFYGWNAYLESEFGLNLGAVGYFAYCTNHKFKTTINKASMSSNGSLKTVCQICGDETKKTIAKISSVNLSKTKYTYDGNYKKPSVTVKSSSGKVIDPKYYTVTYSNNKSVGKATVKIVFKDRYSGTIKKTFKINPKATSISSLTATKGGFKVTWKKKTTQTTGYQVQYATDSKFTKNKKTLTISKNTTTSKSVSKLTKGKKYYVRVRTYKTVNGTKYYSSWSGYKTITTKK